MSRRDVIWTVLNLPKLARDLHRCALEQLLSPLYRSRLRSRHATMLKSPKSVCPDVLGHGSCMKVAILAGGMGTRLAEETDIRPKPMVEIGGRPILWHIMMHYAHYGHNEFVIALGYKGEYIKRYMIDYGLLKAI